MDNSGTANGLTSRVGLMRSQLNIIKNSYVTQKLDWIGLCSVLCPRQHSIGYMGDGFYRSKDPTNSIKVLKGHI